MSVVLMNIYETSKMKRFNTHYEQCMPVIEHFGDRVVKIDATLSTSEVFAQVESKIKEILPGVF